MIERQGLSYVRLSPREIRILMLLLEGNTLPEVAQAMQISLRAVEYHLYDVRLRLKRFQNLQQLRETLECEGAADPQASALCSLL